MTYAQHFRQTFHIECFTCDNTANDIPYLHIAMIVRLLKYNSHYFQFNLSAIHNILTEIAFIFEGSKFLVSSIVDRGGGDEVPASSSSSLSFELSRSLRFCLPE